MCPEGFHSLICLVYGDSQERKVNYNKSAWNLQRKKYHHQGKWSGWEDLQRNSSYCQALKDKENRDFSF